MARGVLISAVPPLMVQTPANPGWGYTRPTTHADVITPTCSPWLQT